MTVEVHTEEALPAPRRGRSARVLPAQLATVLAVYSSQLALVTVLDDDTHRTYVSQVRGYLAWLAAAADVDGDPLTDRAARDGAVRDYKAHQQTVIKHAPATINTTLAALADFYTRLGLGEPVAARLDLPKKQPRALDERDTKRWLRAVERHTKVRDQVIGLLPLYAGLRTSEVVALDTDDIQMSARKGLIIVRAGKGGRYREVPIHPQLRGPLSTWLTDTRPALPGAADSKALLLNHRGNRLSPRGAHDVLLAIADDAAIAEVFNGGHILRHTFGTRLVRAGYDLVLVAELMGHARIETTRLHSLPTDDDKQAAIDSLPIDR
ncbi:tyrosine-type recombinase/integrase [Actinoplanes sp. L3-i22]|uniref:tyrosine-type recombinase/integrase n=1 Tax=Actinoplanes sp. L3-i22 TaxID=2836373 RepID=UPI001C7585BC|nr:tyrosine-type recombinase/integrase [Actinoplanes sp. L3-i22]BCY11134.1 tyrosine recombinase XerD [Actinoplanes sp. L3-i22]